ncbi:hypothetical protein D8T49_11415 [Vibrio vulnificus]|nr:hypothetical protein D8T37_22785 [Vibrio vulnificus]RZQ48740.1 hypothetical protein D8T49_11415 [Vibrio vulnificus]
MLNMKQKTHFVNRQEHAREKQVATYSISHEYVYPRRILTEDLLLDCFYKILILNIAYQRERNYVGSISKDI